MIPSSARAVWLAALVAWATAACLSGCDRLSERTFDEEQAGATQPSAEEPAAPKPGDEGADCSIDSDCNSYLRCIEHACTVPPAVTGEADASTPTISIENQNGETIAKFYVELARTDAEQRRGLMFRREMHPDWGMLFVYGGEAQRSFWMENTFIALDMVFIDASGEIDSIVERAEPLTRVKRRSRGPARYVLELNAGTADAVGIEPGMEIALENVDETLLPTDR